MRFPSHSTDTATGKAAERLGDIVARNGSAGTMVRTMAGSLSVLGGYLELSRAMKRSRLDRAISERVSLAVQARQSDVRATVATRMLSGQSPARV